MAQRKSSPELEKAMALSVDEGVPAASQGVESTATPSESFSTTTTDPTCPTCGSSYPDMPLTEFDNHVAGCTRPSTATTRESSSELSPPPHSSSLAMLPPVVTLPAKQPEVVAQETAPVLPEPVAASDEVEAPHEADLNHDLDEDLIRLYVDPKNEFVYYGEEEGADEADVEPKVPDLASTPPEPTQSQPAVDEANYRESGFVVTSKGPSPFDWLGGPLPRPPPKEKAVPRPIPFPKLTPIEVFEQYLDNPRSMEYTTLYHRTSVVSGVLADLQAEYQKIDKELSDFETVQKVKAKEVDDELKETAAKDLLVDNAAREAVSIIHKHAVKLSPQEFAEWVAEFQEDYPGNEETIRHLQNLRNPVFMAAVNKKKNNSKPEPKNLVDVPIPEDKYTKEELAIEKRKRGKLMDPAKFEDMKQADVYGFEYSSHSRHVMNQPLPLGPRQSVRTKLSEKDAGNDGSNEQARTRGLRNKTRRPYEADLSAGAESDEDRRPAKRVRKPKVFEDGEEANGLQRPTAPPLYGTPAVRTFPSGKRVGRPPSKLAKVQTAIHSESPDPLINGDLNGSNGVHNGVENHGLGYSQEAELHDAAQSLVNQTFSETPVIAPPVKKKHAGGRPRKNPLPIAGPSLGNTATQPAAVPKPRNKGGRPKKIPVPASTIKLETTQQDMNEVMQSTEQADGVQELFDSSSQRPKRKRTTTDSSQNQIIVDAAPLEVAPPPKKRRGRAPRGATEEQERREPSTRRTRASTRGLTEEPERRETNNRRARVSTRALTEERDRRQSTVPPEGKGKGISVPKKRKAVGAQRFATAELRDETGADADIDDIKEENGEVMKKKRATKSKVVQSTQEPRPAKARGGSSVRTIAPQPIRKTSNAVRNAMAEMDRELAQVSQAAVTTPVPPPSFPVPPPYFSSAPPHPLPLPEAAESSSSGRGPGRPKSEPTTRKSKAPQVPLPPPSRVSTRVRRPARHRGGMDGADDTDDDDDEDDEGIEKQFASEYEHYQALTSPGGNHSLGKRVRKSLVDLSAFSYGTTDSDDVEDSFEEVEEDEIY